MIQAELTKLPDRSNDKPFTPRHLNRGRKPNDMDFEACTPLFKALGVDLTEIEGIDVGTALVILAEIGVDVSRFPTEKHFASWLGLCPRQYESNKTKKQGEALARARIGWPSLCEWPHKPWAKRSHPWRCSIDGSRAGLEPREP